VVQTRRLDQGTQDPEVRVAIEGKVKAGPTGEHVEAAAAGT